MGWWFVLHYDYPPQHPNTVDKLSPTVWQISTIQQLRHKLPADHPKSLSRNDRFPTPFWRRSLSWLRKDVLNHVKWLDSVACWRSPYYLRRIRWEQTYQTWPPNYAKRKLLLWQGYLTGAMYPVIEPNVSRCCKWYFHNLKAHHHYLHSKERFCTYTYMFAVSLIFVLNLDKEQNS